MERIYEVMCEGIDRMLQVEKRVEVMKSGLLGVFMKMLSMLFLGRSMY